MKEKTRSLPAKLFGVTVDNVSDPDDAPGETPRNICDRLDEIKGRHNVKPIVRIVFDFDEERFRLKRHRYGYADFVAEAKAYRAALEPISHHAYIMGEIVDSSEVYRCHYEPSASQVYVERTKAYFDTLSDLVDIWEVGNEINGEWVGWLESAWRDPSITVERMTATRQRVASEIAAAFAVLKAPDRRATTAITYYFNDDGVGRHSWTDELKRSERTGQLEPFGQEYSLPKWENECQPLFPGVEYVFLSYYQDDNYSGDGAARKPIIPDFRGWATIFQKLHNLYPGAYLGFGEVGPQCHYLRKDKTCTLHEPNDDWDKIKRKKKCDRECSCCVAAQKAYVNQYYIDWDEGIRAELKTLGLEGLFVGGYFYWYFSNDVVDQRNRDTIKAFQEAFDKWYR